VDKLISNLREVLQSELTPGVLSTLEQKEEEHAKKVVLPRKAVYNENERLIYGALSGAKAVPRAWSAAGAESISLSAASVGVLSRL
jgi:hypothetical protein